MPKGKKGKKPNTKQSGLSEQSQSESKPRPSTSGCQCRANLESVPVKAKTGDGTVGKRGTGKYEGIYIPDFALRGYNENNGKSPDEPAKIKGRPKHQTVNEKKPGKLTKAREAVLLDSAALDSQETPLTTRQHASLTPNEDWLRVYLSRIALYYPVTDGEDNNVNPWRRTKKLYTVQNPNVSYMDLTIFNAKYN